MSRYYFHLRNDIVTHDEEGKECPDLAAACEYAKSNARELAAESVRKGHLNLDHFIEIENQDGQVVAIVAFRDAVAVEGR